MAVILIVIHKHYVNTCRAVKSSPLVSSDDKYKKIHEQCVEL
jgi:hypothetical protein